MKISLSLILAVLLVAGATTWAMANEGGYIGASGGITIFHDSDLKATGLGTLTGSYKTGGAFNINGGNNFGDTRLEGEFGYKNASLDKVSGPGGSGSVTGIELTVLSYMLNGYYDFKNDSTIKPFVGAGLGLLNGKLKTPGPSTDNNAFGYQFMVGIGFKATDNVTFDLSYKYQGAASDFSDNTGSLSYHSSNVLAGLRYNFK